MKVELKRCPFCGGEAEIVYEDNDTFVCVACKNCNARTDIFYNKPVFSYDPEINYNPVEEAAKAWNRRGKRKND